VIPRALTVNGDRWRVLFRPLSSKNLNGFCDYQRREIWIDSEMTQAEQEVTFLHELLHACLPERFPARAEETMVRRLAPRLLESLKGIEWAP
jgi:Zn-dependent peptidase ImmA (M78 family)